MVCCPAVEQLTDLTVRGEQLEGMQHLVLGHTASTVQEVGRFPAVQLHNVHGRHGQTCTVHCREKM